MLTDTNIFNYIGGMEKTNTKRTHVKDLSADELAKHQIEPDMPKLQPVTEAQVQQWITRDLETAIAMLAVIKNNPGILDMVAAYAAGKHNNLVNAQNLQTQEN